MKKKLKVAFIIVTVFVIADLIVSIVLAGSMGGIGPFKFLHDNKIASAAGNAEEYSVSDTKALESSPLAGKRILFLGSSVTRGACSLDESMADYISKLDQCDVVKEAVSGTTLSTEKSNSYIERLNKVDTSQQFDIVVCQLSTNDASKKLTMGEISENKEITDFDTATVIGAMEYIISYCTDTWDCPVVFYTGTKYDSQMYGEMVKALMLLQDKWDIGVINLWDDEEMNSVSATDYKLFMYDSIHPTRAGYKLWWTPKFEEYLYKYCE